MITGTSTAACFGNCYACDFSHYCYGTFNYSPSGKQEYTNYEQPEIPDYDFDDHPAEKISEWPKRFKNMKKTIHAMGRLQKQAICFRR